MTMTLVPVPTACPKCGGRLWDNRESKKNPKQPDFKCRDKSCDGLFWPLRAGNAWADQVAQGQPAPVPQPNGRQAISHGPHVPGLDDAPYAAPLPPTATSLPPKSERDAFRDAVTWVVLEIEPLLREKGIGMSDDVAYKFAFSLWKGRAA